MATTPAIIPWLGGKHRFAPWLAAQLPPHHTYIEPFGGSAAVLLARATPAPVEIYNDLDDGLVGLLRVLRDPAQFAEFHRRAQLLPYSRTEYLRSRATWRNSDDPIERALRWYAVARWSYSGKWGHGWGADPKQATAWPRAVDRLPAIHARLRGVVVEHDDWAVVVDRYDAPDACFFVDPPYLPETRRSGEYAHELSTADHRVLVNRLLRVQGAVVLCGYSSSEYAPIEGAGWERRERRVQLCAGNHRQPAVARQTRLEVVWRNPVAQASERQLRFSL